MKNIFLLIFLCMAGQTASAQLFSKEKIRNLENFDKQILSWGFFLGLNQYDYQFNYEEDLPDILVETTTGFSVGLISDLRISEHLNLRFEPGLFITQRNLQYDPNYFIGQTFTDADLLREVKSTYVHFPLLLKVSTKRINNFKPFLLGGISTSLNLSSNEKNPDDNSAGEFRTKKNVLFYELGFGVDFYNQWFKFTPSIRGIFAINDELVPDKDPNSPWTGNVTTMKTRGVFINFTFQ
ncbi:PorT family protein [Subsaximicrobium wynnwilliamsii]|uniref:PorT family protein n=1 Tax=Subsaximicrobium wynnwilliamsii TaxID=291179 RepID=A0A5C6ZG86_9FLAO|nr:porin family protein [Subsaximicrobium wynnwilliamsii]TXD83365.1 PorT family protein [Subsaximicrobium wynnwilliamsii]TXD89098.1 PorT family protein [Subsaximicrobium wynnwilliamsii]TXE03389.1 PorT family protein [Subsaximicrobium wynnwilliamsii]